MSGNAFDVKDSAVWDVLAVQMPAKLKIVRIAGERESDLTKVNSILKRMKKPLLGEECFDGENEEILIKRTDVSDKRKGGIFA